MTTSNPYAAPTAALNDLPVIEFDEDLQYAGFWRRLTAYLLDSLLFGPVAWASTLLIPSGLAGRLLYVFLIHVPFVCYLMWFNCRTGQTLGKRVMGIRARQLNNQPINARAGFLRVSPVALHAVVALIVSLSVILPMGDTRYPGSGYFEAQAILGSHYPRWFLVFSLCVSLYFFLDFISFLATSKKQSLHDLLAKTIVVRVPKR